MCRRKIPSSTKAARTMRRNSEVCDDLEAIPYDARLSPIGISKLSKISSATARAILTAWVTLNGLELCTTFVADTTPRKRGGHSLNWYEDRIERIHGRHSAAPGNMCTRKQSKHRDVSP
jgi:hypothetical protein